MDVGLIWHSLVSRIIVFYSLIASGDFSFGVDNYQPHIRFNQILTPNVINDDIAEGEEIGQLRIVPNVAFDGSAPPHFQSVRIIIVDDDGMFISACILFFC